MHKLKKLGLVTILVQMLNVIPFIIVTLYFDKIVYGEFAKNISFISILGITSILKMDIYNLEKKKNYKFQYILKYLVFIWSIFFLILYFNNLVAFLGLITVISIGLYDYTAHNLLQNSEIDKFNRFRISRVLLIIISYNLFWFFELSVELLLLIEIISKFVPFLLFYPHRTIGEKILPNEFYNLLKITFSWFINNSVILIIPFILSKNVELEELGWYFIFFKGINQVEILFASTFNQFIISQNNQDLLNNYFKRVILYVVGLFSSIVILGSILTLGLFLYFDYYSDLFLFAMIVTFFSGIGSPFYVVLNKLNMSNFQLKWDLYRFITFLVIVGLTTLFNFSIFLTGFPILLLITYVWLHLKIIKSQKLKFN